MSFHELRHSFATELRSLKANAEDVPGMLGHAAVETTLNIYSHSDPTRQRAAMDVFNAAYLAAGDQPHARRRATPVTRSDALIRSRRVSGGDGDARVSGTTIRRVL